jgi:hypothetical protein
MMNQPHHRKRRLSLAAAARIRDRKACAALLDALVRERGPALGINRTPGTKMPRRAA